MEPAATIPKHLMDAFWSFMSQSASPAAAATHTAATAPLHAAASVPLPAFTAVHMDIAAMCQQEAVLGTGSHPQRRTASSAITPILCTERHLLDRGLVRVDDPTIQQALIKAQDAYEQSAANLKFVLRAKQRAVLRRKPNQEATSAASSDKKIGMQREQAEALNDHATAAGEAMPEEYSYESPEAVSANGRHQKFRPCGEDLYLPACHSLLVRAQKLP